MRYKEKFIKHKATKYRKEYIEIIANVEFSEGDLYVLREILKESKNEWVKGLRKNIDESFNHRAILSNGI